MKLLAVYHRLAGYTHLFLVVAVTVLSDVDWKYLTQYYGYIIQRLGVNVSSVIARINGALCAQARKKKY